MLSVGQFGTWGFIIDETFVDVLRGKDKNMFIWCYAKSFVERLNLHGLYTDMFISEVGEAYYHGFLKVTQEEVTESNNVFGEIVGSNINKTNEEIYDILKTEYFRFGKSNQIGKYNSYRIYYR